MDKELNKQQARAIAKELGMSETKFSRTWAQFIEFKEIVERHALILGFIKGTPAFSRYGLAMHEAKNHGEYEAQEFYLATCYGDES